MAEKEKPKPNLEDLASHALAFQMMEQSAEEKNPSKQSYLLINYIQSYFNKEQGLKAIDILKKDPEKIYPVILEAMGRHAKGLEAEIKKDPLTVAKKVKSDYLTSMAVPFLGDDIYKAVKSAVENKTSARGAFAKISKDDLWQKIVSIASEEAINYATQNYLAREINSELAKELYDKKGKFDQSKAAKYVTGNMAKQKGEEQTKSYLSLGVAYAQSNPKQAKPKEMIAADDYKSLKKAA